MRYYSQFSYSSILDAAVLAFFCESLWLASSSLYFTRSLWGQTTMERFWDSLPIILLVFSTVFGFLTTAFHKIWAAVALFMLHSMSAAFLLGVAICNALCDSGEFVEYPWGVALATAGLSILISVLSILFIIDYRSTFGSPHPSTLAPYRSLAYVGMGSSAPIVCSVCSFDIHAIPVRPGTHHFQSHLPTISGLVVLVIGMCMAFLYRIKTPQRHLMIACIATLVYFSIQLPVTLALPFGQAAYAQPFLAALAVVACIAGHSFVQFAAPPSQQHILACLIVASEYSGAAYLLSSTDLQQHGIVSPIILEILFALLGTGFCIYGVLYSVYSGKSLTRADFSAAAGGYVSIVDAGGRDTFSEGHSADHLLPEQHMTTSFISAGVHDDAALGITRTADAQSEIARPANPANEEANEPGSGAFVLVSAETVALAVLTIVAGLAQGVMEQIGDHTSTGLGPLITTFTLLIAPLPRFPVFMFVLSVCVLIAAVDLGVYNIGIEFYPVLAGAAASLEALIWPLFRLYSPRSSPFLPAIYTALRWSMRFMKFGTDPLLSRTWNLLLFILCMVAAAFVFEPKQRWRGFAMKYIAKHKLRMSCNTNWQR